MQTNEELVENGNGLVPTSITTYYSPIVEVEELVRRSDTPRQGSPRLKIDKDSFADDDWLNLITSFNDPKVNMIQCGYCGIMSRNLVVHIRINYRRNRPFKFSFSGLNSQRRMFTNRETFGASIKNKPGIWVSKPE